MSKRIIYGMFAAIFAAIDAFDIGVKHKILQHLFGESWQDVRDILAFVFTILTAGFSYLAIFFKNGKTT